MDVSVSILLTSERVMWVGSRQLLSALIYRPGIRKPLRVSYVALHTFVVDKKEKI